MAAWTPGLRECRAQFSRDVRDAVLGCRGSGGLDIAADHRDDFDTADRLYGIEMLLSEDAGTREDDSHVASSRIRWPTAVLEAGTW